YRARLGGTQPTDRIDESTEPVKPPELVKATDQEGSSETTVTVHGQKLFQTPTAQFWIMRCITQSGFGKSQFSGDFLDGQWRITVGHESRSFQRLDELVALLIIAAGACSPHVTPAPVSTTSHPATTRCTRNHNSHNPQYFPDTPPP